MSTPAPILACTSGRVEREPGGAVSPAAERAVATDLLRCLRSEGYQGPVEWESGPVTSSGPNEPHETVHIITCTAWRDDATYTQHRGTQ